MRWIGEFDEWWTKKLKEAREKYPYDGPECFITVDQFNYICGLYE